jgi:hypothetical protein
MQAPAIAAKFHLASGASQSDLDELCERIGGYCLRTAARGAIVHVAGHPALSIEQLRSAVSSLGDVGCPEGFRLAWVSTQPDMYETLAQTELASPRSGITARAFLDEHNARKWLAQ